MGIAFMNSTIELCKSKRNIRISAKTPCLQKFHHYTTALATAVIFSSSANALTFDELQGLTYLQVKGSGLANTCPVIEGGSGPKALKGGDYKFDKFCVEPTSFTVKEEKADGSTEFVK